MKIAIFGLGRMGTQIAKRLHLNNFEVHAWNRSEGAVQEFVEFTKKHPGDSHGYTSISDTVVALSEGPRIFWLMLPNDVVESFLMESLLIFLKPGDIVIDGGNSQYKDSMRRADALAEHGIVFYDCGTSGGVWGLERGFALMVGGPTEQWMTVESIFKTLSSGDNYALLGKSGAGHFAKMVHNGIEYGYMQAIGEGYEVLHKSQFSYNLADVTRVYQKGSVITSWLIDLTRNIFDHENVAGTLGRIDSTGEGEWTIAAARELGVDVPIIEGSFKVRQESQKPENQQKFSNKIVALLRKQFGGHAIHT